jgi:hypothetical protein
VLQKPNRTEARKTRWQKDLRCEELYHRTTSVSSL